MTQATGIYLAIMLEVERRRQALGFPMEKFSEYAGLPERYYSKALHPDTASGRQAQWGTLQIIIDALFPAGFDVVIKPRAGAAMNGDSLKAKLLRLQAAKDPKCQRELMRELGHAGRAQQLAKQPRWKRRAIARKAARARWRKARAKASESRASSTCAAGAPRSRGPRNRRPRSAGTGAATSQARAP